MQKDPEYVERINAFQKLDELYPDAKSNSVVEYNGKRYQRKYDFLGKYAGKNTGVPIGFA